MFSESGSIGRFGAQPSRTFSYNRRLHFEAIDSLVPLQLACLLLFWIQHDWHYLLWLIAACAIPMFAITAGTNRYSSHHRREVFSLSNWVQWPFGFPTIMTLMLMKQVKVDGIISELRSQGLTVRQHSASRKTWYIKGNGTYLGYVATDDELIELKRTNRLSLPGVKSLN